MKKSLGKWRGLISLFSILLLITISMTKLALSWAGQVNVFLDVSVPTTKANEETMYYDSDYGLTDDGLKKMLEDSDKLNVQTMVEGSVLLKNDNASLPLKSTERGVTLFGRSVSDPVYIGNAGGPAINEKKLVTLHSALSDAGFKINETLYKAYEGSSTVRAKAEPNWSIGEENPNFYTNELKKSYENDFNDVAIVMFSRDGGEGKDLARADQDNVSYLALHDSESELLKMIKESGKFKKTVVLINSAYPMELGWLNQEEYGINSALWIGAAGQNGFTGVSDVLVGNSDPSGRFVDVYAADSLSSPAVQNFGDFTFSNDKTKYVVQAEGIYVGYKYYETRYQDSILDVNNANSSAGVFASPSDKWNYSDEIAYPFGYGTSYANFSQKLEKLEWDKENNTVKATVNVTNEGSPENSEYKGKSKSVAQLYVQLPYETGNAEKSAVQLIGFEKTDDLAVGESQKLEIEVDDYLFTTYDENVENGADSKVKGAYVFDSGDYFFSLGDNSHDALNNVLASKEGDAVKGKLVSHSGENVTGDANKVVKINLEETDNKTYATSRETGEVVSNQFENIDYNHFSKDAITYLTRSDWNTFPKPYLDLEMKEDIKKAIHESEYVKPDDAPDFDSFKQGEEAGIKFVEMKDVPYDDEEAWDKFLNQLTIGDLSIVLGENFGHPVVEKVEKPVNVNTDGPSGAQGNYKYGDKSPGTLHMPQVVAASTWSKDILAQRGSFIAEDALFTGTTQLWSPGANLHRTPFSGRNFEYYSEDSILSYILSGVQTKAMQEKGLNASIKHFAANDQETNRVGLATYMTEQTYREGPLKGFEGAFTQGGALGTMMSFARVGSTKMYEDAASLTQVLRNEWGFKGITITDSVQGDPSVRTVESLVAGTDTFNADRSRASEIQKYLVANKDGYVLQKLREANKHYYYAMANSSLTNGLSKDTVVKGFVPWWETTLYGIIGLLAVIALGSLAMFVKNGYFSKGKGE